MNFEPFYKSTFNKIESNLKTESNSFLKELSELSSKTEHLYKALIKTTENGKRTRGFLVCLGYLIAGGKNEAISLTGALAYEIFQSSILIHDDVIDQSHTRRGQQTIHSALGNNQYGISQAICLGDIGFFWSIRLLNSANLEPSIKTKAVEEFLNVMIKTGIGEILDVETPFYDLINKADVDLIHYFKTAEYSIIGPLKLGAILANSNADILSAIELFGKNLGLAYQLKDDVLGLFSNEKKTGKSTLTDIQDKKITHMYLHALENAAETDKLTLKEIYAKEVVSENEVNLVKEIFTKSGALTASNKLIEAYINLAKIQINKSSIEPTYKNLLLSFSDFLENREY